MAPAFGITGGGGGGSGGLGPPGSFVLGGNGGQGVGASVNIGLQ